ncbi:MAG: hypothetical protein M1819_002893 [Sarea resinae]|nr:MAG: hypothetical protein M1819_002893 [Sarea resinae]
MGCGSSKQADSRPASARPVPSRRAHPVELQHMGAASTSGTQTNPERTGKPMSPKVRAELLNATHRAFGDLDYCVIGGCALAEYGNQRGTSDLDVMVPHEISEVVTGQLLSHGIVRTARGGLGYIASNGQCYGLDITTDRAVGQRFPNTQQVSGTTARLMPIRSLLNSKAYSYMTRAGSDASVKKSSDAQDILFIVNNMRMNNLVTNRNECPWVVDYDFWTEFCQRYPRAENDFRSLGLQRDATPNSSHRSSRSRASSRT